VAKRGSEGAVQAVFGRWDLEAVVIGEVADDGVYRARWHGEDVVALPVSVLADHTPVYHRPAAEPADLAQRQTLDLDRLPVPTDLQATFLGLLESPNLCAREWVYEQYDQLVGGNTVVRPGGDAALVRVDGTRRALALAVDCNSRYTRVDPYLGAMMAVVEAARNCVAVGARPLGVTDCLNYGNPENPEVMWQFQQGVAGIRDACVALGTPVVSGNVSFYNETDGRSIPPTPTIAMVGLLEDVELHVTPWWKAEGDTIALLGQTREELGASEYLAVVHGSNAGAPPWIDLETEKRLQQLVLTAVRERLLRSVHDVAEGGLAIALAECSFGGPQLGFRVAMEGGVRTDCWLFGESQSRMLVSLRRKDVPRLRELAGSHGLPLATLGEVRGRRVVIGDVIDVSVETCHDRWRGGLARLLRP
jgi:phosphoribosylformylglycinamidine synthase